MEIGKFTLTLFLQNFRESKVFPNKITKYVIDLTKYFSVRVNFSYLHTTRVQSITFELTVSKFKDFTITQFLCEIKYGNCMSSKTAVLIFEKIPHFKN